MQVQSLGQEDPLEKELATHSSILALEIPWTEEPGKPQSTGSQKAGHNSATKQQREHLSSILEFSPNSHLILIYLAVPISQLVPNSDLWGRSNDPPSLQS